MARPWYEEFFDETYLQVYGVNLETAPAQVDFLAQVMELGQGAEVLDLCCGYGRHAVELARRGCRVTGLDLSETLLAKAQELAAQAGVTVTWHRADMRQVPAQWAGRFDAVINMFTAWGYFAEDAEDEKVIAGVARSLKVGGRFLLDFINRDRVIGDFRERLWTGDPEGLLDLHDNRFEPLEGRSYTRRIIIQGGQRLVREHSVRLYTVAEIRAIMERQGLRVRGLYGAFDGSEYSLRAPRAIFVAERQPPHLLS